MVFTAFDPQVKVIGRVIKIYSQSIMPDYVTPVLKRYNIDTIAPEAWYPLQVWLDVLNEINQKAASMANFVAIGMDIAATIPFPDEFAKLPLMDVLQVVPQGYTSDHRGGDIGTIRAEKTDARSLRFMLRTPYPDDFFYGICYGLMRRFAPRDVRFMVEYDNNTLRRDKGGEQTIINIKW